MGKGIMEWVIGPQLIGFIFVLAGFIQQRFPPKNINSCYGYRMPSSMKNQQSWDAGNRYSAKFMIKAGIVLLISGLLITFLLKTISMPGRVRFMLFYMVMLVSAMGSAIAVIVSTEKHLDKNLDNKE